MPFDFGKVFDDLGNATLNNPMMNRIARNPFLTALMIVVVMILIIMFVFRDVETHDDPLYVLGLRVGFWMFIGISAIIFLHNKILLTEKPIAGVVGRGQDQGYTGSYEADKASNSSTDENYYLGILSDASLQ